MQYPFFFTGVMKLILESLVRIVQPVLSRKLKDILSHNFIITDPSLYQIYLKTRCGMVLRQFRSLSYHLLRF